MDDKIFNSDEEKNDISGYDSKSDLEPELSLPSNLSMTQSTILKWEYKVDRKVHKGWGAGF